ncbi:MAG: 50S ribosomal protein L11 [Candidatus Aenigmatarchaeota archaeon]|nr:MAG: 50S ribosomal protein L11 [Candidatus Aenigmarchaeota archaeon]
MAEQTVDAVVEGGKASAAPPLGPALGPLGVNIQEIVDAINEKTKDFAGMKVPVKVIVNTRTKAFRLEVGKPPASALILKELNLQKGSATTGQDRVGDLTHEQVKKIARAKFGSDEARHVNQIKGTCRSMGVTIGQGQVPAEERKVAEEHKMQVLEEEKEKEAVAEAKAEGEEVAEAEEAAAEGKEEEKTGEKAEAAESSPEVKQKTDEKKEEVAEESK